MRGAFREPRFLKPSLKGGVALVLVRSSPQRLEIPVRAHRAREVQDHDVDLFWVEPRSQDGKAHA